MGSGASFCLTGGCLERRNRSLPWEPQTQASCPGNAVKGDSCSTDAPTPPCRDAETLRPPCCRKGVDTEGAYCVLGQHRG